ncbi:MAG: carboxymuconolactone decarboxylase family protein [Thermodesulfobacteriota bacterium]
MKAERGYLPPAWSYLAENDVDFAEAYNTLYGIALADGQALPIKTKELIAIALLAFRGLEGAVYDHVKRALKNGATKLEILEAIETAYIPGGAPTLLVGLNALIRVEADEKKTNRDK